MAKQMVFDEEARQYLAAGVNKLAKAVRSTLETPRGIVALPFFPMHPNDTWYMKDANTSEDFTLTIVGTVLNKRQYYIPKWLYRHL